MSQINISNENSKFWNELCGSQFASVLGITDSSISSLKKLDEWYFKFYPYLSRYIKFDELEGKDVLEIGLGYGTVSQRLAESGCRYTGLDIAEGPTRMVTHRLTQNNLPGSVKQGSILEQVFPSESFDVIVAIGCLHHTGNLQKAIDQCHSLLRPGGRMIFMVYSAYSYRRWRMALMSTARYWFHELQGYRGVVGWSKETERAAYDAGSDGAGAPHTDWISTKSLESLCSAFTDYHANYENINQESPFFLCSRQFLLSTSLPRRMGLDLYATVVK